MGMESITTSIAASAGRSSIPSCEAAYVHVTYGTLIDAPSLAPTEHIFVGSKAPWYEINDDLPQHATFPS